MGNLTHIFERRVVGHQWTKYERSLRDAMASAERGDMKSALASVAYASTLSDRDRPDELSRRQLFREFCASARIWENE